MMYPRFIAVLGTTALLLGVPSGVSAQEPPPLPVGSRAPAFVTNTLTGQRVSLTALRGKVVLLDFWATWCGPCRLATPTLEALHKRFHNRGLRVIGMSVDDTRTLTQVKPFVKQYGMTYLVSADPQANLRIAQSYHVQDIPSQYLIDKQGHVRWSQGGYSPDEACSLLVWIKSLLAGKQFVMGK